MPCCWLRSWSFFGRWLPRTSRWRTQAVAACAPTGHVTEAPAVPWHTKPGARNSQASAGRQARPPKAAQAAPVRTIRGNSALPLRRGGLVALSAQRASGTLAQVRLDHGRHDAGEVEARPPAEHLPRLAGIPSLLGRIGRPGVRRRPPPPTTASPAVRRPGTPARRTRRRCARPRWPPRSRPEPGAGRRAPWRPRSPAPSPSRGGRPGCRAPAGAAGRRRSGRRRR